MDGRLARLLLNPPHNNNASEAMRLNAHTYDMCGYIHTGTYTDARTQAMNGVGTVMG